MSAVPKEGRRGRERLNGPILRCTMQGFFRTAAWRALSRVIFGHMAEVTTDLRPASRITYFPMKARIKWIENVSFVAETGSGHAVVVDGAPDAGGRNLGARPMELVLAGAAACTASDVVWILKKGRQPVTDCVVDAEAERAPEDPKIFTRIHFKYR